MAEIFQPWRINQLTIPNRLVRSATWEGLATPDRGEPTGRLIQALCDLARGGVGLIITGYAFIHSQGKSRPRQTGAHLDEFIAPLRRLSDAVHQAGGLVAMQIAHAGGQTRAQWTGQQPLGPSALTHPLYNQKVAAMNRDQLEDTIEDFARAAGRVKAAGFDGVELHGAHGCLINQFLSPLYNQREDDYGGSLENRARFARDVLTAARNEVGRDYPLFIKLNSADYQDNGLTLEEGIQVARALDQLGVDAIEVSGGTPAAGRLSATRLVRRASEEGYFLPNTVAIKKVVSCPVISVGGWRSRARVAEAMQQVDAVALCRPFIRQPDLAKRWKNGEEESTCVSCNQCFEMGMRQGLGCAQLARSQAGALPGPQTGDPAKSGDPNGGAICQC